MTIPGLWVGLEKIPIRGSAMSVPDFEAKLNEH